MIQNDKEIKESASIVEVISKSVKLKKAGVNMVGLCPFHNEKTPSFTVTESKGFYKCFGCGEGGDVVDFVMKKENKTYPEAIEVLSQITGIQTIKENKEMNNKLVDLPLTVLERSLELAAKERDLGLYENDFLFNLSELFGKEKVNKVLSTYMVGSVPWKGKVYTTFPYASFKGNLRAMQCKSFDKDNKTTDTTFIHSIMESMFIMREQPVPVWLKDYKNQDIKVNCFFGEQLLSEYPKHKTVLTESPKNAIYLTCYKGFPDEIDTLYISSYNSTSLNERTLKVLKGRNVSLLPDTSENSRIFKMWKKEAMNANIIYDMEIKMIKTLENTTTEDQKKNGYDIADYITDKMK